jgi:hypothetical protein
LRRAACSGKVSEAHPALRWGTIMSDKKFWIGAFAALVVTMLFGFLVHGLWLVPDYGALPNLMRTEEDSAGHFHFMLLAHVSIALAFTWIYRQGRKDGDWVGQGLRYGLAIAFVANIPFFMIYHAVAQFPMDLMVKQIVGDTAGMLVAGLAVAFVHK